LDRRGLRLLDYGYAAVRSADCSVKLRALVLGATAGMHHHPGVSASYEVTM